MPPEAAAALAPAPGGRTRAPARRLTIVDVAMFYGDRSGGIRSYLEAKAEFAAQTAAFEHHLVVPGRIGQRDAAPARDRHEQRSLRVAASNRYRVPRGSAGLQAILKELQPDVVMLHDRYWTPRLASRAAHEVGATVIAVHHSSPALHAAGIPGPRRVYATALRRWYRRAYVEVDAVMSCVDTNRDSRRPSTLCLRLGLHPAFRPRATRSRGDHVLYVGRLSREKGLREQLEATTAARDPWPLVLIGTGPAQDAVRERAAALGLDDRVRTLALLARTLVGQLRLAARPADA